MDSNRFHAISTLVSKVFLCAVAWFAAFTKLFDWNSWQTYCEQFGSTGQYILFAVPVLEFLLPAGLLFTRTWVVSLACYGLGAMYLAFAVFHWTALQAGNSQPCSCFGPLLSLLPNQMFGTTLILAMISLFTAPLTISSISKHLWKANKIEQRYFHVAILVLVSSFMFRSNATASQFTPPPFRSKALSISQGEILKSRGSIRITNHENSKGTIIIVVDPNCQYSSKLLQKIESLHVPKNVSVDIVHYPVLSDPLQRTKSLAQILNMSGSHPMKVGTDFFDSETVMRQHGVCEEILEGRVPAVIATDGVSSFQVSTNGDLQEKINDFSSVIIRLKE